MNLTYIKTWFCDIFAVYVLWVIIHYASANLYPLFCAELTLWGFVKSAFVAETPQCVSLRWLLYNSGSAIHAMWVSIGIWFTGKFIKNAVENK